jgi:hypothetical protein
LLKRNVSLKTHWSLTLHELRQTISTRGPHI